MDRRRAGQKRFPRLTVDLVVERGGETHCAQHAKPVFGEALRRIANRAHQFRGDIRAAADEIDHLLGNRIVKHSVDREIATFGVFLRRGKTHLTWMSAVHIRLIRAKGRNFELKIVLQYDNHAETRTYRVRTRENVLHLFRSRVSDDVIILRSQIAHHIAHTAAREIRDVPSPPQAHSDFTRSLFHRRWFHRFTVAASLCEAQRASKRYAGSRRAEREDYYTMVILFSQRSSL